MLVDSEKTLSAIFAETGMLIAAHCEDQSIIEHNIEACRKQFGNDIPIEYHPMIRSAEACYRSSARAMELADRYAARLHVLHLSTERETGLLSAGKASNKKITAEVCVQYLLFSTQNMPNAALCKCNPAIKEETDRIALLKALAGNKTDTVATDHAPHLLSEKQGGALQAASGAPMVQHSLQAMLSLCSEGFISRETVVEKMCHAPADLFHIERRGYIRKGYYADMVLIDPQRQTTVDAHNILYKCGWSSLEGKSFNHSIDTVFLNGQIAFHNGEVKDRCAAMPLYFDC
jgi:dihydroorotase